MREASKEELIELWNSCEKFWDDLCRNHDMIDFPWTRNSFLAKTFKVMLKQKGWKIPPKMRGGF